MILLCPRRRNRVRRTIPPAALVVCAAIAVAAACGAAFAAPGVKDSQPQQAKEDILGPLGPMPATGRSMEVLTIDIVRVEDGQFAEHWGLGDVETMARQLGWTDGA